MNQIKKITEQLENLKLAKSNLEISDGEALVYDDWLARRYQICGIECKISALESEKNLLLRKLKRNKNNKKLLK